MIINPKLFGEDIGDFNSNQHTIPHFVQGKFMLLKVAPPQGKTVRNGLVLTAALLSYKDADENEVEMVTVKEGPAGFEVEFPLGKRGISSTKYRGPKSVYKFVDAETGKWKQIGKNDPVTKINELMTEEYADSYLSKNLEGYNEMSDTEKDMQIDEYLSDMFMFGLSKDLALEEKDGNIVLPQPGMVVKLYRRYTPPKEGEKYGNVIITKWATQEKQPSLDGSFDQKDPAIANAILTAYAADAVKKDSDLPF